MDDNSEKSIFHENNDENNIASEHEEDLLKEAEIIAKLTQAANFGTPEYVGGEAKSEQEINQETIPENETNETTEPEVPEKVEEAAEVEKIDEPVNSELDKETKEANYEQDLPQEPNQWEELDNEDSVVKKYIFYVSKDFVPLIDSLTTDERSAYINDAIQRKIDAEYELSAEDKKKKILTHLIVMILTFFIVTPLVLFLVHKSIMVTFENYKYSQDNFEKLYKQRFEKDRAYMRSLEYNKLHNKENKK